MSSTRRFSSLNFIFLRFLFSDLLLPLCHVNFLCRLLPPIVFHCTWYVGSSCRVFLFPYHYVPSCFVILLDLPYLLWPLPLLPVMFSDFSRLLVVGCVLSSSSPLLSGGPLSHLTFDYWTYSSVPNLFSGILLLLASCGLLLILGCYGFLVVRVVTCFVWGAFFCCSLKFVGLFYDFCIFSR